jgi:ATP-dependent helicase HrpA
MLHALTDVEEQLHELIYPGFLLGTPPEWLPHLPRYLQAVERRLQRLEHDPARDRQPANQIGPFWERCRRRLETARGNGAIDPRFEEYRWMVEEYRVSLFAQELGTAKPVSEKRLERLWSEIGRVAG